MLEKTEKGCDMRCFICRRKIWFFQRRTRVVNPAIRKLLAIADLSREEEAGWMHSDCQLGMIYEVLNNLFLAINAMEGYLFTKKQEKQKDEEEEKRMVIMVRAGVVEKVVNLPEGWNWDVEYLQSSGSTSDK
jgi:hypothetical protein